jgi:precorrin-6Y C5,15-methyltransferase (decarboxylating)
MSPARDPVRVPTDEPARDQTMITVVGIGADGWDGLLPAARRALSAADVLVGSHRQLALVPESGLAVERDLLRAAGLVPDTGRVPERGEGRDPVTAAERVPLPSPLLPNLPALLESLAGREVCVLASGDPMFFGIGSTLIRLLGADQVRVLPHVSSVSLACARLGWPVEQVDVVSAVGRPLAALRPALLPGRRVLVLGSSPEAVIRLVDESGYAPSRVTVLSDLGAPTESVQQVSGTAAAGSSAAQATAPETAAYVTSAYTTSMSETGAPPATAPAMPDPGTAPSDTFGPEPTTTAAPSRLHVIAVECVAATGTEPLPRVPGLSDEAFEHDGQLTKREVRAVSLSRLAPLPGQSLWDVGAGAGSIAIEWMRAHPSCTAVAIESGAERAERIRRNAHALGVPGLQVVRGRAPAALDGLPAPDAVFVGGGATVPGLIEACWAALRPGGRLVANAVTLESETVLASWYGRLGGDLVRLAVQRAAPVGGFTGWRPAMPVTIWSVTKGDEV